MPNTGFPGSGRTGRGGSLRLAPMSRTVSPALARLAGLTCAAVLLVGCSSAQPASTPRTDSTRATVSSDANTGQSANLTDFASAKLRTVDPCGLLDHNTLSQLGKVAEPAVPNDLDSCQADLDDGKDESLGVEVTIGDDLASSKPTGTIAGLPVTEQSDSTECSERLITQHDPTTGIEIRVNYKGDNGCVIARQLAGIVVNRIRTNAPQRPAGVNSLAVIDPCDTIDNADAENLTAVGVDRTVEGLFTCDWQAGDYDLSVKFSLDGNPKDETYDGTPQPVDVGVPAYAFPSNDVYPSCDVKWLVRLVDKSDNDGEVVDVQFGDVLGGSLDPCTQAEAAAKLVATKVPRAS
jgi:hypothetical protein